MFPLKRLIIRTILIIAMSLSLSESTHVSVGHGHQADAFQCGREAAQMAKGQLHQGPIGLALVLGSDNFQFQNLVEGVRLVTGEEKLIGIPFQRVFTSEFLSPDSSFVVLIQSSEILFTLASAPLEGDNVLAAITSLSTQLRNSRGNLHREYDHRGLVFFDNTESKKILEPSRRMAADIGLDSWVVGLALRSQQKASLVCKDNVLPRGFAAIECLSSPAWGLSEVHVSAFKGQPDVTKEAVKAVLRDALSQMEGASPAFGFLSFNTPLDTVPPEQLKEILVSAKPLVGDTPLIGIQTSDRYFRNESGYLISTGEESVAALLAPK
ncbi:MAG: hypothetical protein LHV69_05195 [Elusimicrobia bacterium]|nr:hypothetical protein [Candidatus Obscuribacterium magneticum]